MCIFMSKISKKCQAMKVALAQMVSGDQVDANLAQIEIQVQQASKSGAQLIVFPENCVLMKSTELLALAQDIAKSSELFDRISKMALDNKIAILLGSVPLLALLPNEIGRVRAAALTWNMHGELVCRYDKIHLFDAKIADTHGRYKESKFIAPGSDVVVTQVQEFCVGMSICYDLRFPDLFQRLRGAGAQIIVVPAAFTEVTGSVHWQPLLQARAIETQCYILGVNQGGQHGPTRETHGHTMAINPWGELIGMLEKGPGLLVVDLALDTLESVRDSMPVFEHRRNL